MMKEKREKNMQAGLECPACNFYQWYFLLFCSILYRLDTLVTALPLQFHRCVFVMDGRKNFLKQILRLDFQAGCVHTRMAADVFIV